MELKRAGTRPVQSGPPEWFTGSVRIEFLNVAPPEEEKKKWEWRWWKRAAEEQPEQPEQLE